MHGWPWLYGHRKIGRLAVRACDYLNWRASLHGHRKMVRLAERKGVLNVWRSWVLGGTLWIITVLKFWRTPRHVWVRVDETRSEQVINTTASYRKTRRADSQSNFLIKDQRQPKQFASFEGIVDAHYCEGSDLRGERLFRPLSLEMK